MVRRNFADVLAEEKIDITDEYFKIFNMLFQPTIQTNDWNRISVYNELGNHFQYFHLRGTCIQIDEFDRKHGFLFKSTPQDITIDDLVNICEYMCNMMDAYRRVGGNAFNMQFIFSQISIVMNAIGYEQITQNGYTVFIEKSPAAVSVAESHLIPADFSYKILYYNHYSMKGNIDEKKAILIKFAELLEPREHELSGIDGSYKKDLFALFNNMNIRHNNIDPADPKNYKQNIAEMSKDDLEHWYDEIYQMCLLAFMRLEHFERRKAIDTLKSEWDKK